MWNQVKDGKTVIINTPAINLQIKLTMQIPGYKKLTSENQSYIFIHNIIGEIIYD